MKKLFFVFYATLCSCLALSAMEAPKSKSEEEVIAGISKPYWGFVVKIRKSRPAAQIREEVFAIFNRAEIHSFLPIGKKMFVQLDGSLTKEDIRFRLKDRKWFHKKTLSLQTPILVKATQKVQE